MSLSPGYSTPYNTPPEDFSHILRDEDVDMEASTAQVMSMTRSGGLGSQCSKGKDHVPSPLRRISLGQVFKAPVHPEQVATPDPPTLPPYATAESTSDLPVEPAAASAHTLRMGSSELSKRVALCLCVTVTVVVLVSITVYLSFSSLDYYEIGFKRRRTTGSVDTSKTYEKGLYLLGPDYEFKTFMAEAHFETFVGLSVFNADRLEVHLTTNLQYFLRPHQLRYLHKNFDIHYKPVIRKNALDALKGAATVFTNREMIFERDKFEKTLFKAVKDRLGGQCCEKGCWTTTKNSSLTSQCEAGCKRYNICMEADFGLFVEVRYFQLHELLAPPGLLGRYLKALTLGDENQREQLRQTAIVTRKDTDQLVQQKMNSAAEISENATAWSGLIRARASAEAKAVIEQARSEGLRQLYSTLSIVTKEQKNSFDYLRTLRKHKRAKLAVEYDTYVSGPMREEL